jgi:DnaJ family protein A protein 2
MPHSDLYATLGLDRTASKGQVTKAYRKLAKEVHPDKIGGNSEKFKEINHAHEILSDPHKRSLYDRYGEEGLENGGPKSSGDIFSSFFGDSLGKPQKRKTKDVVHVMPVTLEQLYNGKTKKMAVRRDVVDQESGVNRCAACDGRGSCVRVVQMGNRRQQISQPCGSCSATGQIFKHSKSREELEVHIQKGAPDGHKVVFREKADELPGAETGDVVFVLKQQEHKEFKRKGADLYMERTISLVEALCGFELEVTHLDGRKLLIKSAPGDVVKPMPFGFDALACDDGGMDWEMIEGCDCPAIATVAEAALLDAGKLKHACETELKRQGVDVSAFVIDQKSGLAYFKSGTRAEVMAVQQPKQGCKMYVVADPEVRSRQRLMKAVKDEGMPTLKNPFVRGNLFIILSIEFPQSLSPESQEQLRELLPPPLNTPMSAADDIEVHELSDIDPVQSRSSNQVNMSVGAEAYDEDEEVGSMPGQSQCAQM